MLKLIPYHSSFLHSFIQWRCQSLSVRHNPLEVMSNEDIARALEAEGSDLSEFSKYKSYRWFVESDGIVVGSISLKNINHMMCYAEVGYMIDEAHHNKGIATAAVKLLVQMCFGQTSLRKLIAYVHDKNV